MKFLAVKGFDRFQHYRDRNPPWIKLYATVLTDLAFLEMPEAAQAQLVKLWVLASQFGHPLPNNPRLLAGKIGTTGKFHLATIVRAGFLIPCERGASMDAINEASGALAEMERDARPPVRVRAREERTEREVELEPSSAAAAEAEAGLAVLLETDADRNALTVIVGRANDRPACIAALKAILTGNDPAVPQPSAAVFGAALRDLSMNGAPPTARLFRAYLKRAAQPDSDPSGPGVSPRRNGRGPSGMSPGAQQVANILGTAGGHRD